VGAFFFLKYIKEEETRNLTAWSYYFCGNIAALPKKKMDLDGIN